MRRDVEIYFDAARSHGLRIRYALDTHQHNDFLSGICELPARSCWTAAPRKPSRRTSRGALNVGSGSLFATWAGTVLPPDQPIFLVVDDARDVADACAQLLRIGYEIPKGWLAGGMLAWRSAGKPLALLEQIDVRQLREKIGREIATLVVDVRQPREWNNGRIERAVHITGAEFPERLSEIPRDPPVALICSSGLPILRAATLLQASGHSSVVNVLGGMTAWKAAGFPTADG